MLVLLPLHSKESLRSLFQQPRSFSLPMWTVRLCRNVLTTFLTCEHTVRTWDLSEERLSSTRFVVVHYSLEYPGDALISFVVFWVHNPTVCDIIQVSQPVSLICTVRVRIFVLYRALHQVVDAHQLWWVRRKENIRRGFQVGICAAV